MRKLFVIMLTGLFAAGAYAANPACDAKAAEKKLAGAAKTTKCMKDAKAADAQNSCDAQAAEKKLHGAAQTSFTKKCVTDATK